MLFANVALAQQSGDLKVKVTGLKSNNGEVSIALDNSKEAYLSRGKIPSFRKTRTKVIDKAAQYTFEDIPFGDYTIKLYHDENANKEIDKNLFGIPIEDYAISNNVRAAFGLPSYEKAKFSFDRPNMIVEIDIEQ